MNSIAIKVDQVSKQFKLPHEKVNSLKKLIVNPLRARQTYETQKALSDISFDIKKGEFFGIVGRNGSGKSTLLKILAGIYQPTSGKVSTQGKLVPFIELGVGFNPELSGRENVFLNGALLGFSRKEIEQKYDSIVAFSELERFMDQKLKNYSSGMQVRLAFAVAVIAEADILLVDEVLAVGDADFQKKCFSYFRQLKKQKKTVVFVSHDMNAVREYCDRAVLIEKGVIAAKGSAEDVSKKYIQLFIKEAENEELPTKDKTNKWGIGTVDITDITISDTILDKTHDMLEIGYTVKSLIDQKEQLIMGLTIKNEAGQGICGSNSLILKKNPPLLKKDETIQVKWHVPNIFNDGKHYVEPAVVRSSDKEVCQWWDSAKEFEVVNEEKTPYLIAPTIRLSIDK